MYFQISNYYQDKYRENVERSGVLSEARIPFIYLHRNCLKGNYNLPVWIVCSIHPRVYALAQEIPRHPTIFGQRSPRPFVGLVSIWWFECHMTSGDFDNRQPWQLDSKLGGYSQVRKIEREQQGTIFVAFEHVKCVKRRYVRRTVRQPRGNRGRFLDRIQGPRCRVRVFDQPGISPLSLSHSPPRSFYRFAAVRPYF